MSALSKEQGLAILAFVEGFKPAGRLGMEASLTIDLRERRDHIVIEVQGVKGSTGKELFVSVVPHEKTPPQLLATVFGQLMQLLGGTATKRYDTCPMLKLPL